MKIPKVAYIASRKRNMSKYLGSRIISSTTKELQPELEPCSHLCIILKKTLVIESTIKTGVRIIPYNHWIKENEVVYAFDKPYEGRLSQYIPKLMDKMWGKDYDKLGILYFTWRMALFLSLGLALPKVNKWQDKNKRFCVEIFGENLGMTSPIQMVALWLEDDSLTRILKWQD